ncbi:hypothetical protein [Teredinibacter waterburyi]|uniref:hypothetical protein n=1 Tax=Teredinibacter waterburyi TaxID=1500538 RepID=UPI00165EEC52|nr:hypothetical protein [Teredinibacter waterburyi]
MSEADNDWRMEDFGFLAEDTRIPGTNQVAPRGSQVTRRSIAKLNKNKHVSIVLPNATALCLSSAKRSWDSAQKIRKRSGIDSSIKKEVSFESTSESFDYIEAVMESIVMSFTALEDFVNENIPDDYLYHCNRKSEIILETLDKQEIERWLSLDEKLSIVLPQSRNMETPKGQRCWEGYRELRKIRDRIIHMKKEDRRSSGPEIPTIWHKLLKINASHMQAKAVIDFFVKQSDKPPRWYEEYPRKT